MLDRRPFASPRELERRGEIFAENRLSSANVPVSRVSRPCRLDLSPKKYQSGEYSPWPARRPVFSGRCYFKVLDKLDKGASSFVRSDGYIEHASIQFHTMQKLKGNQIHTAASVPELIKSDTLRHWITISESVLPV